MHFHNLLYLIVVRKNWIIWFEMFEVLSKWNNSITSDKEAKVLKNLTA